MSKADKFFESIQSIGSTLFKLAAKGSEELLSLAKKLTPPK